MKIVIAGGTGQLGAILSRALRQAGYRVVILSRHPEGPEQVAWDGRTLGAWADEVDGCDGVINLAGRTVNCRYSEKNLREMMDSRVESTRVVGEAIARAKAPPRVWLQMSTATLYAHRFDAANDEVSGVLGGDEPDAPAYWKRSVEIARAWERAQEEAMTPQTRKVVLRTAMVMSPDAGGVFDVLSKLVRAGLGGAAAGGPQYVSWLHQDDFVHAILFLLQREDLRGPVNLASPHPLPQRELMKTLREAWGRRFGLPTTKAMLELGAFILRTDTELLLKSRRVVPTKLLDAGFVFSFPHWEDAARDLVAAYRARGRTAASPREASA
ncbi:TIGR01777 family protein [Archangium gephyra]|nr:TIGR01777 family protein [Archangium gephyra]